jgi:hypothetical protein
MLELPFDHPLSIDIIWDIPLLPPSIAMLLSSYFLLWDMGSHYGRELHDLTYLETEVGESPKPGGRKDWWGAKGGGAEAECRGSA